MNRRNMIIITAVSFITVMSMLGTFVRNNIYKTNLALWRDCAEKNNWRDMRSIVAYVGALKKEGEYVQASEMLEKARQLKWDKGRFNLANVKFLIQHYADYFPIDIKIILHEFLLDLDPDDHRSYEFITAFYLRKGDLENARIAASAMNRTFLWPGGWALMGDVYSSCACYEKAEREYVKAVENEKNNPLWRFKLIQNGAAYKDIVEIEKMLEEHKQYLSPDNLQLFTEYISKKVPEEDGLLLQVAILSYKSGDYERTHACIERLMSGMDGLSQTDKHTQYIQAAGIYSDMKEFSRAYTILSGLKNLSPEHTLDRAMMLGRICRELGRKKESSEWYDKALALIDDPEIAYIVKRKKALAEGAVPDGLQ